MDQRTRILLQTSEREGDAQKAFLDVACRDEIGLAERVLATLEHPNIARLIDGGRPDVPVPGGESR